MKTVKLIIRFPNGDETDLTFDNKEQFDNFNWRAFKTGDAVYIQDGQFVGEFYQQNKTEIRLIRYVN